MVRCDNGRVRLPLEALSTCNVAALDDCRWRLNGPSTVRVSPGFTQPNSEHQAVLVKHTATHSCRGAATKCRHARHWCKHLARLHHFPVRAYHIHRVWLLTPARGARWLHGPPYGSRWRPPATLVPPGSTCGNTQGSKAAATIVSPVLPQPQACITHQHWPQAAEASLVHPSALTSIPQAHNQHRTCPSGRAHRCPMLTPNMSPHYHVRHCSHGTQHTAHLPSPPLPTACNTIRSAANGPSLLLHLCGLHHCHCHCYAATLTYVLNLDRA